MKRFVLAACVLCAAGAQAAQGGLALVVSRAGEAESRLVFVDSSTGKLPDGGARIAHLPDGVVRGALVPGHGAVVVADRTPTRDRSWGASLLRVDGTSVVELCDRVDHASRPLVTADGRVLVSRGRPGAIARAGELRTDELTVEEVDLASGATRIVWRGRGYQAHLAGSWNGEVLVYHIAASGSSLLAVGLDGGAVRTVAPSLPLARDFSVDGNEVAFAARDGAEWVADAIDLSTGARRRAWSGAHQVVAPHFLGNHVLAVSAPERGLLLGTRATAPAGDGVDVVRATAGSLAAVWHYPPGRANPDVLVVDGEGRLRARVAVPERSRLEIVGFVGGAW